MQFGVILTRFVQPHTVTTHFHFRNGDCIGDFGAGSGYFLSALSRAVGSEGTVYALEIQKNLVAALGDTAKAGGLQNVEPLWCDFEADGGALLADGILDGAVFINVLFQLEDKTAALREAARTLRKGGKLFIIDWSESFGGIGPAPEHVITEVAARELVASAGFSYERDFPAGEHHYGLGFRKI